MNGLLLSKLKRNPVVEGLLKGKRTMPLTSLVEEALIISAYYTLKPQPILIVKKNLYSAQRLYERIAGFLEEGECALFGVDESLRVEAIASSPEMKAAKVETLAALTENPCRVVVTNVPGFLRQLPLPEVFSEACVSLSVGQTIDPEELKRKLRQGGYGETTHIDQPLSFAARGGIVDVYSINYEQPIRIEFFDDEVESIRFFDVRSQRTMFPVDQIRIVPASDVLFTPEMAKEIRRKAEVLLKEESEMLRASVETDLSLMDHQISEADLYRYYALLDRTGSIQDYMQNPQLFYSDPDEIDRTRAQLIKDTTIYMQELVQEEKSLPRFSVWHDESRLRKEPVIIDPFADSASLIEQLHLPDLSLDKRLKVLSENKYAILCVRENEAERIMQACIDGAFPYHLLMKEELEPKEGLNILLADMPEGFYLPADDLAAATSSELFDTHHHNGRFERKFHNAEMIHSYDELEPGDYVVHSQYGVGQYVGLETREIMGAIKDFLKVVYRGNAELLVPLEQFRLVRKFVSRQGVVPRLNKLGSGEWEKTKTRLEENVSEIAERLVNLYASRKEDIGYAYQPDSELQRQFEKEFEYELTPDQISAVADVKHDMEQPKPMDRLVCGDVGFGKTEIAVRASFKAAAENKQVAVLCPTTILAEQHYRTFRKRFAEYPFTIRRLDRFVPPSEMRTTLEELANGRVDIVVGTHRLLSGDVVFKDLGLLVVDEEQRFGVEHKERIKEIKAGIDVLTLSATPIPRTLQMSLIGIRSLSQLETPPTNRYTVQTYVVEKNMNLVEDAIERELSRDGQVFYLHNNVQEIYNVARTLQTRIPDAKIGVVHGQMGREEIEDVMMRFINHELDVLVCTTIVENGIDIPNANTILIDQAQNFGLSQIYQIKGRVGRSDRAAYAYLMVPPRKQLNETAQKRLQAVREFTTLGSGYKIAMRDLTIRGAGDLLGPNQSGFIDTVGIDLYIEMLETAIQKKKGTYTEAPEIKKAAVNRTGYIPKRFAPDDFDKISMYQAIDLIQSEAELLKFQNEVRDQYGRLPKEVESLFVKRHLDILLNTPMVESYQETGTRQEITFSKAYSARMDGVKLFEIYSKLSKDIALRYMNQCISASIPRTEDGIELVIQMIQKGKEALRHES